MKNNKKRNAIMIIITVIVCCIFMAFIETIVEPPYFIKSLIKIIVFFLLPLLTMKLLGINIFKKHKIIDKKIIIRLLVTGIVIYLSIMIAYYILNKFLDFSSIINSLSMDQNVNGKDFIFVALYISFCNSLLEEFLFRYFSFIKLSEFLSKKWSYVISSILFAIYHISMVESSFPLSLILLMIFGLSIGGFIFDYVDDKDKNICNSWIIHMFADFAIMTIWFLNI